MVGWRTSRGASPIQGTSGNRRIGEEKGFVGKRRLLEGGFRERSDGGLGHSGAPASDLGTKRLLANKCSE